MDLLKTAIIAILAVWVWNKVVSYAKLPSELEA